MTEEPTLAEYGADGAGFESGEDSDRPPSEGVASEEDTNPDGADDPVPAEPTYGWGEYDCARCGSATDRVWRGEDGFVCPACKEW